VQPVSWASLALLIGAGAGVMVYFNYERERRKAAAGKQVTGTGKPMLGGPYNLVDHHGKPFSSKDLEGKYSLLYFGFSYCPDICPNELVKMGKVIDLLEAQKDLPLITPVLVSVDPHRDTVAQMRTYIADFHPRMVGLTGTPQQVGRAAKAFRVFFQEVDRAEDEDDYVVDHSIVMYFMDPKGNLIDFYPQMVEPQEIADRMARHMRRELGLDSWNPAALLARLFGGGAAVSAAGKKAAPVPTASASSDVTSKSASSSSSDSSRA
jgi:protein SCO1